MSTQGANKDCICGIKCDVENCIHNNHHCGCTAKKIEVGPHRAESYQDTVCQSFREDCGCH